MSIVIGRKTLCFEERNRYLTIGCSCGKYFYISMTSMANFIRCPHCKKAHDAPDH